MGLPKLLYLEYQSRKLRRSVVTTGLREAKARNINVQVGGSGTLPNNPSDIHSRVFLSKTEEGLDCYKLGELSHSVNPELTREFSRYTRLLSWEKIRNPQYAKAASDIVDYIDRLSDFMRDCFVARPALSF